MTSISALENIYKKGLFGDHEGKNDDEIIKISEKKNLLIVQIVKYKKSNLLTKDIKIEDLILPQDSLKVNCNKNTRILWCGPNNWLLVSVKKELLKEINKSFINTDFAVTDLSHSRTIIELKGKNSKEILKKGCPFNFNDFRKDNCINSIFNGITVTIDMINEGPDELRIFALRSFGESIYHSITDACLEDGYKAI